MTDSNLTTSTTPQAASEEVQLGQIFTVFWRGRWIILLCTLLGAIGGYFYVQQRGTIWRAQSKVYVEKKGSTLGPESLLLGVGAKNYANTQAQVMVSSTVLDGALAAFHVEFPRPKLFDPGTIEPIWLLKELSVNVGRDDDIISVSLDSNHKQEACAIVRHVVEGYQKFQATKQKDSALDLHQQLMKDKGKYDKDFADAIDAQANYRKDHPGVGSESGALSILQDQWRAKNVALAQADDDFKSAEEVWNTAKGLKGNPTMLRQILPSLVGGADIRMAYPPNLQAMTGQILNLQRERANLLVQLQPDHPRVKTLDEAVAKLKKTIADQDKQFAQIFTESLRSRYEAAKTKRDQSEAEVAELEGEVFELDALEADYSKLLAEVDSSRNAMNSVYERLQMINVDTDAEPTFVHILHPADPATAEVASGKPMRLAAALLLGFFAGAGLAWLRGMMDQRIRTAEEVRKALELPILAIMPRVSRASKVDGDLTAIDRWDTSTQYAEAARSLRTAVYFGMPKGEGNVVQITSSDAADGKTTIAANLAIAMAKAGQRTLLIDADMRKPQQAKQFALDNNLGLATLLDSTTHKLTDVVQETDIPALHVMTSGPVPPNPTEMLNSPKFENLLADLSKHYDHVIVDSPPVLPVADARIIATRCRATVLTVRVDKSTRKRISAARDMLVGVGAKILGIALNDMPHGIGYGYGAGYGYYGRNSPYGTPVTEAPKVQNGNGTVTDTTVRTRRTPKGSKS